MRSRGTLRDTSKFLFFFMGKGTKILNLVYSVQGLKSIGYVQLILSTPPGKMLRTVEVAPAPTPRPYLALGFAALAFIAAFFVPFLHK